MKMILRTIGLAIAVTLGIGLRAQQVNQDSLKNIQVDPFDHQDDLGQAMYVFLLSFENLGHLGEEPGGYASSKMVNEFGMKFDSLATLPNDLSGMDTVQPPVSIHEYQKLAKKHGYLEYSLIVEKKLIAATRVDSGRYAGQYRYFKLFNEQAFIGKAFKHGAVYEMDLEFNQDGSDILIKNIRMIEGKEYHIFQLGKFGYTSDNRLKAAYNLDRLVLDPSEAQKSKFAPPKDSSLYRAGISILAFGGVLQPNYLGAVTYPENLVMNTPSTNEQWGYTAGIKFFFPAGKKGNFNFTLGLGYERNEYNLSYGEMRFNYNLDCFGNPLTDFEGTVYDEKRVAVSSYKESGHLGFIQPEFGLLYHINFGKKMKLTLFGNVGFSYLTSSSFKSEAVVSYQGVKDGLVIDVEQLGFYQDHQVNSSGEISNAISFYKAGYGGSLDFRIGKRQWLALAFEMRQGLSPVLDTGYEFCPFLDADVSDNFLSTFTNIESKREYEAMGVSVSYRYQFPKK